jgi:hypothetical protein
MVVNGKTVIGTKAALRALKKKLEGTPAPGTPSPVPVIPSPSPPAPGTPSPVPVIPSPSPPAPATPSPHLVEKKSHTDLKIINEELNNFVNENNISNEDKSKIEIVLRSQLNNMKAGITSPENIKDLMTALSLNISADKIYDDIIVIIESRLNTDTPPKAPTPKAPTPKAPTPKAPTPKAPTPKSPTPKAPTPKAPTPKAPTPKAPTPKSPTPKAPTPKAPKPKKVVNKPETPKLPEGTEIVDIEEILKQIQQGSGEKIGDLAETQKSVLKCLGLLA